MARVDQRHHGVKPGLGADILIHEEGLGNRGRIGKAGGFDDDGVKATGPAHQTLDHADQVAAHSAADAAIVHLVNLFVGFDDQIVVDADLAEFIDNHCVTFAVRFGQNPVEQGGFTSAEIAG